MKKLSCTLNYLMQPEGNHLDFLHEINLSSNLSPIDFAGDKNFTTPFISCEHYPERLATESPRAIAFTDAEVNSAGVTMVLFIVNRHRYGMGLHDHDTGHSNISHTVVNSAAGALLRKPALLPDQGTRGRQHSNHEYIKTKRPSGDVKIIHQR